MRSRRASHGSARPLNCGVMRRTDPSKFSVTRFLWSAITLLVSGFGCSVDEVSAPLATGGCYYPPLDISSLERELSARSISFSRNGDCLSYSATTQAIESAEFAAFGAPPPSGLSTGSANPSETVRLLEQGGVKARIMTYGRDWVVWDAADAEKAETLLSMSPERRGALKRMRENQLPSGVTLPPPQ